MTYEFHVGDFVQTKDDEIGYITKLGDDGITLFDWYCESTNQEMYTGILCNITKHFKRIGQYAFIKPDAEKIEHIKVPVNRDKNFEIMNKNFEIMKIYPPDDVMNKINQIIDAVNKLNEKI